MSFEEWKEVRLGEIVESISRKHSFDKERIIFLNTSDVYDGRVLNHEYVSINGLPGQAKKSIKKGDILFSEIRPINRRFAYIDFDAEDYVVSTKLMVLRSKEGVIPKFLYYFLSSNETLNILQMLAESRSGTFPQITFNELKSILIFLPPEDEQSRIINFMECIDKKIELNNQINKNLEEMAQAIFKSWFVDFEPFQNGEFVESELGLIPKGWEVKRIEDIAEVTVGGDWGKDSEFEGATPVICLRGTDLQKLKEVGFSSDAPVRFVKKSSVDKRKLQENDILIGGSGLGPVGRSLPYIVDLQGIYNYPVIYSNFCKRLRTKNIYFALYLEHVLEKMHESGEIKNYVNGTSVPNLDIQGLLKHKILMPPQEIVRQFGDFKKVYYKNKFKTENIKLSNLRDTLLPKLMSGEIRVPLENEGRHQDEQLQRV
jgi:type I restriction enzyme S subunit